MIPRLLPTGITLRPATPGDRGLLLEIYAGTREAELELVPWTPEQRDRFVAQQYEAQDASYRARYPVGEFLVVERDGVPIGRLTLARLAERELRIVDVALLPDHRGAGLGTALMRSLLTQCDEEGVQVSLHVERWSAARRLYARLGFVEIGASDVHLLLERRPGVPSPGQLKTAS